MARIPKPSPDPSDEDVVEAFRVFDEEGRRPISLYEYLAWAPGMLRGFAELSRALRYGSETTRRVRELAILRIAQVMDCRYEWCHHVPMALKAGVSVGEIEGIAAPGGRNLFEDEEAVVLLAAEEIASSGLSVEVLAKMRVHYTEKQIVELVLLITHYLAVAKLVQSLGIEVEAEYAGVIPEWPRDVA